MYEIIDISVSGNDGVVIASATFQAKDDISGEVVYSESLSVKKRVAAPAGWYVTAKAELLMQRDAARARYEEAMGKVLVETGKANVTEIITDIQTTLEGGL